MSNAQADGFSDDEGDVNDWRGGIHPEEGEHPPYCRCNDCIAWYRSPEAYLIARDGLPPE